MVGGELVANNAYIFQYDGTRWQLVAPAQGISVVKSGSYAALQSDNGNTFVMTSVTTPTLTLLAANSVAGYYHLGVFAVGNTVTIALASGTDIINNGVAGASVTLPKYSYATVSTDGVGHYYISGLGITVNQGGTGQVSLTSHAVLLGNTTSGIAYAGPVVVGQVLISNGVSADPSFSPTPTLGIQNTTQGTLTMAGSAASPGQLALNIAGANAYPTTIQPGANAGAIALTLPITTGTLALFSQIPTVTGAFVGAGQANTYTTGLQDFSSATMKLPTSATVGANSITMPASAGTVALVSQIPSGALASAAYPGAGIAVSTSSAWGTSLTAPTGSLVGTGQANTYTTGLQDFSSATMKQPTTYTVGAFTITNPGATGTLALTSAIPSVPLTSIQNNGTGVVPSGGAVNLIPGSSITLTTSGAGVTIANTYSYSLPAAVVQTAQANTYSTGLQDFSSATVKLPGSFTSGIYTVTIPQATDTLVNLAGSQALTNKTISGLTVTTSTGTLTVAAATTLSNGYTMQVAKQAGVAGGIPWYDTTTSESASALLTAHGVMVGGGASAAPSTIAASTTTTLALFATATNPAFRAIAAADLPTGVLYSYAGTTDTVNAPANTTTNFATTYTIPANTITATTLLRITIGVTAVNAGSEPATGFVLLIGGVIVYSAYAISATTAATHAVGGAVFHVHGTAAASGSAAIITNIANAPAAASGNYTPFNYSNTAASANVATNGTLVIQPAFFSNAATSGNSLTLNQMIVELLVP